MDERLRLLYSNKTSVIDPSGNTQEIDGSSLITWCLHSYLQRFSKKLSGCVSTAQVNMTGVLMANGKAYFNWAGIYKVAELNDKFISEEKTGSLPADITDTITGSINRLVKRWDDTSISKVQSAFRECPGDQYFYIPLIIDKLEKTYSFSHANGILLNKAKGTVMRIEPQFELNAQTKLDEKIKEGILRLCNEIGLKDPTWVEFETTCPQTITKDRNCAFWSMFLFKTVLENLYKDPNVVVRELTSKPKEQISASIESFKQDLITKIIPEGLKLMSLKWPDFESQIQLKPVIGKAPVLGGKNGKRKSKLKTKRKHGFNLRKTGKARG